MPCPLRSGRGSPAIWTLHTPSRRIAANRRFNRRRSRRVAVSTVRFGSVVATVLWKANLGALRTVPVDEFTKVLGRTSALNSLGRVGPFKTPAEFRLSRSGNLRDTSVRNSFMRYCSSPLEAASACRGRKKLILVKNLRSSLNQ